MHVISAIIFVASLAIPFAKATSSWSSWGPFRSLGTNTTPKRRYHQDPGRIPL